MIQFYRGLKSQYNYPDNSLLQDAIFFATDTGEILVNGISYGCEIIDDLESLDTNKALSANQGKILNDKIETLKTSLSKVYTYKGSVSTYSDLPQDPNIGDVYNVETSYENYPAGTNWAWNGSEWDALGGKFDIKDYLSEIEEIVDNKFNQDLSTLEKKVENNTKLLNIINSDENTKGSLQNTLKLAKDYTDSQLVDYSKQIEANKLALQILNGSIEQEGSILNIIDNILTWEELN